MKLLSLGCRMQLVGLFPAHIPAQWLDSAEIAKKLAQAVVLIKGTTDKGEALGTQYTRRFGAYMRTLNNKFIIEYQTEITKISTTRIEGCVLKPPKGAKFECQKGNFNKPATEWETFAWIPE